MTSKPQIISDPTLVTPAWLGEVLRFAGVADGEIAGFEAKSVGTGQMGHNVRFSLEWRDAAPEWPKSVVGKFPSDDPKSRAAGVAQGVYGKEVRFYNELKDTVGIRTPRCFFGDVDPTDGGNFVMLMEDLAPAVQGDQLTGCSVDAARLALSELARLHAPRWADPQLEKVDFLARSVEDSANLLQMIYKGFWMGFAERYGAQLPAEALALSERLGDGLRSWVLETESPPTLVHGDYRLDNMMFGTADGGYPLAVVDWQTIALGPGLGDAAYFLGASLLTEDRRVHERDLIRTYYDDLCTAGVSGYSWDDCWREYRRQTFAGVVMSVVASMLVEQTERGDAMFLAMATRHTAHALDLDSEELLA
jgi:hypothetical protein